MLYYVELEKEKELLEIKEASSIDELSRLLKTSWGNINEYLNGDSYPTVKLDAGVNIPFIQKKSLYLISYYKEIIEDRNYRYMSLNVINELMFMDKFKTVPATSKLYNKSRGEK